MGNRWLRPIPANYTKSLTEVIKLYPVAGASEGQGCADPDAPWCDQEKLEDFGVPVERPIVEFFVSHDPQRKQGTSGFPLLACGLVIIATMLLIPLERNSSK